MPVHFTTDPNHSWWERVRTSLPEIKMEDVKNFVGQNYHIGLALVGVAIVGYMVHRQLKQRGIEYKQLPGLAWQGAKQAAQAFAVFVGLKKAAEKSLPQQPHGGGGVDDDAKGIRQPITLPLRIPKKAAPLQKPPAEVHKNGGEDSSYEIDSGTLEGGNILPAAGNLAADRSGEDGDAGFASAHSDLDDDLDASGDKTASNSDCSREDTNRGGDTVPPLTKASRSDDTE